MTNVLVMTPKMTLCESLKKRLVVLDPLEEMQQEKEVAENLFVWTVKMTEGISWCQMPPFLPFPFCDVPLLVQHITG